VKGDDQDDMPDFLDLKKTLPPDEYQRRKEGTKRPPARAKAPPDRIPVPPASALQERQKEKSRVRIEKLRAKQSGATQQMPAVGRAALALINQADDQKENPVMRTQVVESPETPKPKRIAKPKAKKTVKVLPDTSAFAPKAKPAPKAVKVEKHVKGDRLPAGTGVGALAKSLILEGLENDVVLAKVKKAFPNGATNSGNISWYRMWLRKNGQLADTPMGVAAAKKLQKAAARTAKKTSKKAKVTN
jgi:hypothetical protein